MQQMLFAKMIAISVVLGALVVEVDAKRFKDCTYSDAKCK
jgi:hypothetical protein